MMNREQVIKGLECCGANGSCLECPYINYLNNGGCMDMLNADALALIREQQEVIQRLCDALKPEPPKEDDDDQV